MIGALLVAAAFQMLALTLYSIAMHPKYKFRAHRVLGRNLKAIAWACLALSATTLVFAALTASDLFRPETQ